MAGDYDFGGIVKALGCLLAVVPFTILAAALFFVLWLLK